MTRIQTIVLSVISLVAWTLGGCGSTGSAGGAAGASGATPSGASSNGGGPATGGASTGGASVGGTTSGGTGTGGASTGGDNTGGVANTGGSAGLTACSPGAQITACTNAGGSVTNNFSSNCRIVLGKYWIWNNLWGDPTATDQSVWADCNNGSTIGWGTSYDKNSGATNSVKSYDSAVLGWHWGWQVNRAQTGLPIQISSNRKIGCDWTFNVKSTGTVTQNGAYDLWIHDIPTPDWQNDPTDEVMIWLYRSNGAGPISNAGSPIQNVNLGGATWTLHLGSISGGWKVWSYVRNTNATTSSLNIMEFLQDLVTRGYVQSTKYLSSIESGTEVFWGQGEFDTTSWGCTIN